MTLASSLEPRMYRVRFHGGHDDYMFFCTSQTIISKVGQFYYYVYTVVT